MSALDELLTISAARHKHLCPRQVLGVRMGLLAGQCLELDLPRADKRLLAILETDGCLADGVAAATGCSVGHRTLRVEDIGKVAACFVDVRTEQAVRVWPRPEARALAAGYAPEARNRWLTYLLGYQRMPVDRLLAHRWVELVQPVRAIISRPGKKAVCQVCLEEIFNEREVSEGGRVLCQSCAHGAYFRPIRAQALASPPCPAAPADAVGVLPVVCD